MSGRIPIGTRVKGPPNNARVPDSRAAFVREDLWKKTIGSAVSIALPVALHSTPVVREVYWGIKGTQFVLNHRDTIKAGITCLHSGDLHSVECDELKSQMKYDAASMTEEKLLDQMLESSGAPADTASNILPSLKYAARMRPRKKDTLRQVTNQAPVSNISSERTETKVRDEKRDELAPRKRKEEENVVKEKLV
jgi:hypothetical protein